MAAKKAAEGKKQEDGKQKHTVDLPKTTFGMRANSIVREPEIQKLWDDNQVFKRVVDRNNGGSFVLHDGPPYANGNLHIGLALNKILKDIINRYKKGKSDMINSKRIYSRTFSSVVDIISEYQCDEPHDNEKAMEKDAALRFAISRVASEFGRESMLSLQRFFGLRYTPIVPTGSLKLDLALGVGGLPKGRIVEIYGPESSGKTTLALHIIKEAQKNGGYCAFLDVENALDPFLAESIGVNTDNLLIARPNSAENLLSIAHTLARSGSVEVIVVDSVAALTSQREIDVGIDGHCREVQSRLMTKALKKISSTLCQSKTLLVFLNQVRRRPSEGFGRGAEITCGGNALEFYSAVRLKIARKGLIQKEDEIAGLSVCVQIVKNKLAPAMTNADLDIIYGRGFAYEAEILEMACQQGVISKRESGYCIEGEILKDKYEAERQKMGEMSVCRISPALSGMSVSSSAEYSSGAVLHWLCTYFSWSTSFAPSSSTFA
ncbi:Reca [Thalictrum thalictroides]|uniref:Reca n=1 Tax=Thalictrum thalictroides TaxID=46969 RepID=A0A7J6WMF1_THATH|nr:Reca [Thalictrum thalictroides]